MSQKKQFQEKEPVCKVTFIMSKDVVGSVERVNLAGEFNNWNTKSIPMKKNRNGDFSVSIDLEKGREYHFKYVIDGHTWINEPNADKHVSNPFLRLCNDFWY
jgi:1,4-alpha-glucan branching enzyme